MQTGDKFADFKWRTYYVVDDFDARNPPLYGVFRKETIIGCLVDMDRGLISFYKDGNDLG